MLERSKGLDHFVDLDLSPDPDLQVAHLMSALFAKLHRALVGQSIDDIGVSFPEFKADVPCLGRRMRLHGERDSLERLLDTGWLQGMRDHVVLGRVTLVPPHARHRVVRRVQVQSSPERMRRRLMRRHGLDAIQARQRIPDSAARFVHAPFVQLRSASTGQSFRLFIEHGPLVGGACPGRFTTYGLSQAATVPWF